MMAAGCIIGHGKHAIKMEQIEARTAALERVPKPAKSAEEY
jgi:hypothetical protein